MIIGLGSAFIHREARYLKTHLHIIISNPDPSGLVAKVNLTSCKDRQYDGSCLFDAGDHPFIHEKTFVNYRDANLVLLSQLEGLYQNGSIELRADADELLERIWQGAQNSRWTSNEVRDVLRSQGYIQ
jgi:hypothetical protein